MRGSRKEIDLARYHTDSFGWALSCCDWDRSEAEDVLQEAYLKYLDGRARFDGRAAFKTWLFAVIRRTAAERRRKRYRRERLAAWFGPAEAPQAPAPDRDVARSQAARRVVAALATLPARQREVLHLVFYGDLSVGEAARVMGVSVGSARTHYDRGKRRLARLLDPDMRP